VAKYVPSPRDWVRKEVELYERSGGTKGTTLLDTGRPRPFGRPVPRFNVDPPVPVPAPRTLTVTSIQIQYSQTVILNFKNLSWPHVSVATLVPADPVNIPDSAWS
jgi:hypothetical protein